MTNKIAIDQIFHPDYKIRCSECNHATKDFKIKKISNGKVVIKYYLKYSCKTCWNYNGKFDITHQIGSCITAGPVFVME